MEHSLSTDADGRDQAGPKPFHTMFVDGVNKLKKGNVGQISRCET
jgi:hypothetical protein